MVRAAGAALLLLSACGDDGGGDGAATATTTATTVDRPEGPAADLSDELTGGQGVNMASAQPPEQALTAADYEQHEYAASGTATAYRADGELGPDGRWSVTPGRQADYRSRIIVRRPADAADASGIVVLEWLNVSGGFDADPEWQMTHEDLTRHGDTWVGVSAQSFGVMGGKVAVPSPEAAAHGAGAGLKKLDPARYGTLDHPGDDFSYDIFTQVGRALRAGGRPLQGVAPATLLAAGESQSAFALVTYIDAVQPLTKAFDGFLVHSRAAPALPVSNEGGDADIASALTGGSTAIFRTDTTVPVLDLQAETDVTGYFASAKVRQDDTGTFRLWEMPGTAHADTRLVGDHVAALGCGAINDGPMHLIAKAGYRALVDWVTEGKAPPKAPRIDLEPGAEPAIARDADGNATGGIRTPLVDVPVDELTGAAAPGSSIVCLLSGQTIPLSAARISEHYEDRDDYQARYTAAADEVIDAGFVLEADRGALMAKAQPERVPA